MTERERAWWQKAVVYQIYTRSFLDSNGDGIGDFGGVIRKLDTLKDLGIDVVWLSPFCLSPNDDNGYDISDYYSVQPEFGTMEDLEGLIRKAGERGMKTMMDLVINHTSDEHPWFRESRASKTNPKRNWYLWAPSRKDGGLPNNWDSFFGGKAWEWDEATGEYYCHIFSKKQPDLNWANPEVRAEMAKVAEFWANKGVGAFRLDAIHLIGKPKDLKDAPGSSPGAWFKVWENRPETHRYLRELNEKVFSPRDIFTVGETGGTTPSSARLYTDRSRKELDTIFHFDHVHAFDPYDARELMRDFKKWYDALSPKGWDAPFLSNHDLPRQVSHFGQETLWRERSAQAAAALLLTSWGTPFVYQGEEYGLSNAYFTERSSYRDHHFARMVDELEKKGSVPDEVWNYFRFRTRDNARVPLPWDRSKAAGFTTGVPWMPPHPQARDMNAEADRSAAVSVFRWYQDLIHFRKNQPVLIRGDFRTYGPPQYHLAAFTRKHSEGHVALVLINWSHLAVKVVHPSRIRGHQRGDYKLALGNYAETSDTSLFTDPRIAPRPMMNESLINISELRPYEVRIYLAD